MIEQIAVRNFQSLASVTLDLGRITVIVGPSDSGKSALIRALEAAAFNESVFDYVTHLPGKGEADKIAIAFKLKGGNAVIWEKTPSSTQYRLFQPGKKEQRFTKMGRSFVPDDIRDVLGFHEITIDKNVQSRIQFAAQMEQPFLLGDRGGVFASRVLGRLTGVHVLSNASRNCKSDKDRIALDAQEQRSRVIQLRNEFQSFADVDARKAALQELVYKLKILKERQNQLRERKRLKEQWAAVLSTKSKLVYDPKALEQIEALEDHLRVLWQRLGRLQRSYQLAIRYRTLQQDNNALESQSRLWENFISTPLPDLIKLTTLRNIRLRWDYQRVEQDNSNRRLAVVSKALADSESNVLKMEKEFPLCPFEEQFPQQKGVFRCNNLMKVISPKSAS